ncbi:MAG: outer membrane protein assembly factor BamA [Thermodesulfobacteriota bacterium]|nr:outer membrane protein assembly factor BamA [Thermodesulfobacteriota bacterium]
MMIKKIWITLVLLLLSVGICSGSEEVIHKITILGNMKIEEGVIRAAVKSREGNPFSADQVREDLRSVFGLGYFSDVQVDIKTTPKGREIIFIVMEKPAIKEILITGNQKVKLDDIKEKVTLTTRSILNIEKVKENGEQIQKLYFSKGYYGVKVAHKIDYLETNEAVVTFQIEEGVKGHIQKIVFKGNKKIKSSDLKKIMLTKQKNILYILTKTGILDEDILKNDIQMLAAYYIDHGYLDVKIPEPKIDLQDPKKIQIEIEISEGPQYRIGEIDFKGDVFTTKEDLFRSIKIKRNHIYSTSAIRKDINSLTEKFANQGYANVEVTPTTSMDEKNLLVHLTFEIEKKKQVSFEKIQIVGNTKTRDKVIRRELRVAEEELYSATGLSKSKDRLKRTGFFKEVEVTTSRGSTEEKTNLEVKVEEAPTGALSFGIGYSSIENVVGSASISDRNLFGLGYHGLLKFRLGSETRDLRLGFTDPYFLGYNFAGGIDLYNENREFDTYSYKILGGDLRFGKELTETLRADALYKLERIKISDVSLDASRFIREQEGSKVTSALSFGLSMDTRNDYYNPTKGARHSISLQNAGGILGGDNYFVKGSVETSWFFPLPLKTVLNLRGKVGFVEPYGGREVPIYEKFFVGGLHTLRGFEYGMAGPFDINKEPLGSKKMVSFQSELIFPLSSEIGLKAAIFWDVGKGFDRFSDITPLKTGVGAGIRWFSPFGPIHIDLGINPNPKPGEKRRVFDFTAGTVY